MPVTQTPFMKSSTINRKILEKNRGIQFNFVIPFIVWFIFTCVVCCMLLLFSHVKLSEDLNNKVTIEMLNYKEKIQRSVRYIIDREIEKLRNEMEAKLAINNERPVRPSQVPPDFDLQSEIFELENSKLRKETHVPQLSIMEDENYENAGTDDSEYDEADLIVLDDMPNNSRLMSTSNLSSNLSEGNSSSFNKLTESKEESKPNTDTIENPVFVHEFSTSIESSNTKSTKSNRLRLSKRSAEIVRPRTSVESLIENFEAQDIDQRNIKKKENHIGNQMLTETNRSITASKVTNRENVQSKQQRQQTTKPMISDGLNENLINIGEDISLSKQNIASLIGHKSKNNLKVQEAELLKETEFSVDTMYTEQTLEKVVVAAHFEADSTSFKSTPHYISNNLVLHPTGHYKEWKFDNWYQEFQMHKHVNLTKDGHIIIQNTGLYFVYAQICFTEEQNQNGYEILKNNETEFECITSTGVTSTPRGRSGSELSNTCFTGGIVHCRNGDELKIRSLYPSRRVMLESSRSFFGMVKIATF